MTRLLGHPHLLGKALQVVVVSLSIQISESSADSRTPPRLVGPPLLRSFLPRQAIDEHLHCSAGLSKLGQGRAVLACCGRREPVQAALNRPGFTQEGSPYV